MKLTWLMIVAMLALVPLGACGTKGKLKSPDQITRDNARKAKQDERDARSKTRREEAAKQREEIERQRAEEAAKNAAPSATPAEQQ